MSVIQVKHTRAVRRHSLKKDYKVRCNQITGKTTFTKRILNWLVLRLQLLLNGIIYIVRLIAEIVKMLPRWIAEQFYFCPMHRAKANPSSGFLITGHRGAPVKQPENTLESLALALQQGANALEVDICITKDEQVIVWHDWDPDSLIAIVRQLGLEPAVLCRPFVPMDGPMRKPAPELTLDEFNRYYGYCKRQKPPVKLDYAIPTLQELLQWAVQQTGLQVIFLDVKIPEDGQRFAPILSNALSALISQLQPQFGIIMLSPFERILTALKSGLTATDFAYDVILPQLISVNPESYSAVKKAQQFRNRAASVGRPAVIGLAPWTTFRRVIDFDLKLLQEADDPVVQRLIGWTINNRREMKCLIRKGVSGLLTDYPGRLATIHRRLAPAI
jgi:glycerophosphoryl diester phosphodiesterase